MERPFCPFEISFWLRPVLYLWQVFLDRIVDNEQALNIPHHIQAHHVLPDRKLIRED
jgi:hypothetical protein